MLGRREFLTGAAAVAAGCASGSSVLRDGPPPKDPRSAVDAVVDFLWTQRRETAEGIHWRAMVEEDTKEPLLDIYYGTAGVALFYLELHRHSTDARALVEAVGGARFVASRTPHTPAPDALGLYSGVAGHGLLFLETHRTTQNPLWRDLAEATVDTLRRAFEAAGAGGYAITDLLYGSAGIILYLLELETPEAQELALKVGLALVDRGIQGEPRGRRWLMTVDEKRDLPGFSHGTAGVAYALGRLGAVTGDSRCKQAALDGAEYLVAVGRREHGALVVPHHLPGGEELYYLALCHGPAGHARLFALLDQMYGGTRWSGHVREGVRAVQTAGIPEVEAPGFWENYGACCGSASVASFLLDVGERDAAREFARHVLVHQGASGGWKHAENRVEPYWRRTYTGYMQGAAGIASMLLRFAGDGARADWRTRWPDDPWPARTA